MNDVRGDTLKVGDSVYIYFGYNELKPGTVKQIRGKLAKVLVDAYPNRKEDESRYSLSKWKPSICMIKAEEPTGYYPDEVILLLEEIRRLRDEAPMNKDGLPTKQLCQGLLNFWDMKRPMKLVTS